MNRPVIAEHYYLVPRALEIVRGVWCNPLQFLDFTQGLREVRARVRCIASSCVLHAMNFDEL